MPDAVSSPHRPTTHPSEELLIALASGQLDLAYRVVLEAHLSFCSDCAQNLAWMQAPGGVLLSDLPEVSPPPSLWDRLAAQLPTSPAADELSSSPLPAAARAELPPRNRPRRWLKMPLSTLRSTRLWTDQERRVELHLLSVDAGERFPNHVHLGREQVVVLAGGYSDPVGHFAAGDFAPYPKSSAHAPLVDHDEPCWIVTRIEQGVRFTGWRGLFMRLFA